MEILPGPAACSGSRDYCFDELMKVLISPAPPPKKWTKFHRDPDCPGVRMTEETYGGEYLRRDLADLPAGVEPCQFECCFQGFETLEEVISRLHRPTAPPPSGIRVGDQVEFRELGTQRTMERRIVRGSADHAKGEISADTPIGQALLGSEPGEVVAAETPKGVMQVEILRAGVPD